MRDHEALLAFLAERRDMPFAWGLNDCATFIGEAVLAHTGQDILDGPLWASRGGAARRLKSEGGLKRALDARLTRIPVALAKRGDVAGVPRGKRLNLMIVEGDTLVGPGANGLERLPRTAMTRAWSVDG